MAGSLATGRITRSELIGPALVAVPAPSAASAPRPVPAPGERPATIQLEDQPPVPDIPTTPSGLPVRVPQANLTEPLRADEPVVAGEPQEQDDPGRSPAEIKRIMDSYQRGTRRGRSDAARSEALSAREGGAAAGPAQEGGTDTGKNAAEGEKEQ